MSGSEAFEPVVGPPLALMRAWRIEKPSSNNSAFVLRSVYYQVIWPPGGYLTAACRQLAEPYYECQGNNHAAPEPEHFCGIYAVTKAGRCQRWAMEAQFPQELVAVGEVDLWGRIYRHIHGVRAEFARPKWIRVLLPVPADIDPEEVAAGLVDSYHVPVHAAEPPWL